MDKDRARHVLDMSLEVLAMRNKLWEAECLLSQAWSDLEAAIDEHTAYRIPIDGRPELSYVVNTQDRSVSIGTGGKKNEPT